jgi:hypothetical protein
VAANSRVRKLHSLILGCRDGLAGYELEAEAVVDHSEAPADEIGRAGSIVRSPAASA